MDEAKMNVYLNKIPREIRHSIKKLDNDKNWAIYLALMFEGRKSFNDLKVEFDANSNEINRALTSLTDGGLISRRIEKLSDIGKQKKSLYYSTTHGRILLNCLFDTIPTRNVNLVSNPHATQYKEVSGSIKEQQNEATLYSGFIVNPLQYQGHDVPLRGIING